MNKEKHYIKPGEVFNRLTVINEGRLKRYVRYFLCKCECGKEVEVRGSSLNYGSTQSCGCLISEANQKHRKFPGEFTLNLIETQYKHNAKRKGIHYSLSRNDFRSIVQKNCYYCGVSPKPHNGFLNQKGEKRRKNDLTSQDWINKSWIKTHGMDRLDNEKGYDLENSVPCCTICNRMKLTYKKDFFIEHIQKIIKYQKDHE